MQEKEEKVEILVAMCTSLPTITKKAALLWAEGVLNPDAAIIPGVASSSSEEPGTSTRGNPPGSQDLCGGFSTTTSPDPSDFLHPLHLPADCLIAGDLDSASKAEVESNSKSGSERELNKACPPPSDFQDVSHNPSMRVAYRDLVP